MFLKKTVDAERNPTRAFVARDQSVKVSNLSVRFGAQDSPEPLRLLLPRAKRAGNLNEHIGIRQIQREITDLDKKADEFTQAKTAGIIPRARNWAFAR